MKSPFLGYAAAVLLFTGATFAAEPAKPADASGLSTQQEKAGYSIGLNIGKNFKQQALDIDTESLIKGLKDGLAGKEGTLSEAERTEALNSLQKDLQSKQEQKLGQNKKDGEAFLAENKKKEGIIALSSGLQYKIVKEGSGPKPKTTDTVETNYRGTLLDGTEFDSSYKRGETAKFPVGEVIKGWTEALQLMTVGSKWQLFIPADLAYGENPPPGAPIPPNATLIFDIELIAIK